MVRSLRLLALTVTVSIGHLCAGLIFELKDIEVKQGVLILEHIKPKVATGFAQIVSPAGVVTTVPMPPAGGRVGAFSAGNAGAQSVVDLAAEHTSVAAGVRAGSGWGAAAEADIHKRINVQAVPVTIIDILFDVFLDPFEMIDPYFGPGVTGALDYNVSVRELSTGATLFDSRTHLTHDSPDVVTDSTGNLNWVRSPGLFGGIGVPGETAGIPNAFSSNRWVLQPFDVPLDFELTLDTAGVRDLDFQLLISTSGSASAGAALFGVSSVIPEPSTFSLLALAAAGGVLFRWRRRKHVILAGRNYRG